MAMRKAVFHISNGGELFDILQVGNQYVAKYDVESITATLLRYKDDYLLGKAPCSSYPEFDLNNMTRRLESLFVE